MSKQNFKIKNGLSLGDHELFDTAGNLKLPEGASISVANAPLDALPSQSGNNGKYLSTDGSSASWETITQYTPPTDQGSGKFLAGDGTYKTIDVSGDISTAINGLVNGAPAALDTLKELADAINDDASFASTITTSLGNKVDKTTTVNGHALSSNVTVSKSDVGLSNVDNTTDLNKPISTATQSALDAKANLSGATFTGAVTLNGGITANTSVINIGSGQIYKDTSGNVGIGTSSPSYKLDIAGSIGIGKGQSYGEIYLADGSAAIGSSSSNKDFYIYTNGSKRATIDSSGNVGIGTTTPSQKLQISTNQVAYGQGIPATTGTTQNGIFRLVAGASYGESLDMGVNVYSPNSYSWIQSTNNSNLSVNYPLALNPNGGNVGIGTSSPATKLHVSGGIISATNTSGANDSQIRIYNDGVTAKVQSTYNTTGSYLPLTFLTSDTERMRIDSSGNVGIGVTPRNSYTGNSRKTLEIGNTILANDSGANGNLQLTTNAYLDAGGTWRYTNSYFASMYESNTGTHNWYKASSGTAGNAITWTQAMSLDASSNLAVTGTVTASSFIGNATSATNVAWSGVTSKPTTLSGYGITDKVGKVLQVVHTSVSNTVSVVANGTAVSVTGFNATITPSSTTSRIWILAQIMYSSQGTTYGGWFTRNGTAINWGDTGNGQQRVSIGLAYNTDTNQTNTFVYSYVDNPSSTSALTYQFWVNNDNGYNLYLNRSQNDAGNATGKRGTSTITLVEVAG